LNAEIVISSCPKRNGVSEFSKLGFVEAQVSQILLKTFCQSIPHEHSFVNVQISFSSQRQHGLEQVEEPGGN